MEDDLDDSAETTARDTVFTSKNFRKKQKFREKQKEKKRKARSQNSKYNTHDKDEMS